ncbi:MAG TPA: hypothetical protein VD926_01815 [Acidimicrobiales bacterium]|nr:hypothetical protein [Acidimicrobiales bacterium]
MAADAAETDDEPRRRLVVAGLVVGVAAIAATAFVVLRGGPGTIEAEDRAEGERLQATLVVRLQDEAVSDAAAVVEVTNPSDRPAYYAGSECSGPTEPWIGPEGARGPAGVTVRGTIRERLIAAGAASRVVPLYPTTDPSCDATDRVIAVDPHETVTFEYRSSTDPVDRSSSLRAVAAITEVTRRGRELGRLRLVAPLETVGDDRRATVDQAVDAFLADAAVQAFLADADDDVLTHVAAEEDGWRISISAGADDIAADVGTDLLVRLSR